MAGLRTVPPLIPAHIMRHCPVFVEFSTNTGQCLSTDSYLPLPLLLKEVTSVRDPSGCRGASEVYRLALLSPINLRSRIHHRWSIRRTRLPEVTGAAVDAYGMGSLRT